MNCVQQIIELQSAVGIKQKQEILMHYADDKDFCRLVYYALNPLLTYNVSEDTLQSRMRGAWQTHAFHDIFDVCETLATRRGVDDHTIDMACSFLRTCDESERNIYTKLLGKTLRLGVTAKTVNKLIPGLIPEWEVQQAYPISKYPIAPGTEFWLTQKLNGVRATYCGGKLIARSGAQYNGLDHIINTIEHSPAGAYVLDGELTLKDKGDMSDNEAFRMATGIINSDDADKSMIGFTVFDIIEPQGFAKDASAAPYSERRRLMDVLSQIVEGRGDLSFLPVLYHGSDPSKIAELLEQMVEEDKEGLMLNTNVPYRRARHKGILKIKRFYTMDLRIVGCEEGAGRLAGTLGSLMVDYKGNVVNVGSGFTDEQRHSLWAHRHDLVGALCEVQYKELSRDKATDQESLQFPVFIRMRTDKTDVSFG